MEIWTLDEFKLFYEACGDDIRAKAIFSTLFWTGMRLGELLALTLEDVDFDKKIISVNKTFSKIKNREIVTSPKTTASKRNIAISHQLIEVLKEYISKIYKPEAKTRIFFQSSQNIRVLMKKYADQSGIKLIRVHDLRHSHVSLLIHLGVNPLLISKRLGHEKVDTTLNVYSHLYPDSSDKMIALLEEL